MLSGSSPPRLPRNTLPLNARDRSTTLRRLAARYQAEHVVPRCGTCRVPCCRLETLVLELDWRRLSGLWRITGSRRGFDAALARGEGPPEIRAAEGLYYAYRRVCPAYDEPSRRCRVYDGRLKPAGCTDFPVYEEEGCVTADLRCEAVDLDLLERALREGVHPDEAFVCTENKDFPFLVRFEPCRRARRRG